MRRNALLSRLTSGLFFAWGTAAGLTLVVVVTKLMAGYGDEVGDAAQQMGEGGRAAGGAIASYVGAGIAGKEMTQREVCIAGLLFAVVLVSGWLARREAAPVEKAEAPATNDPIVGATSDGAISDGCLARALSSERHAAERLSGALGELSQRADLAGTAGVAWARRLASVLDGWRATIPAAVALPARCAHNHAGDPDRLRNLPWLLETLAEAERRNGSDGICAGAEEDVVRLLLEERKLRADRAAAVEHCEASQRAKMALAALIAVDSICCDLAKAGPGEATEPAGGPEDVALRWRDGDWAVVDTTGVPWPEAVALGERALDQDPDWLAHVWVPLATATDEDHEGHDIEISREQLALLRGPLRIRLFWKVGRPCVGDGGKTGLVPVKPRRWATRRRATQSADAVAAALHAKAAWCPTVVVCAEVVRRPGTDRRLVRARS